MQSVGCLLLDRHDCIVILQTASSADAAFLSALLDTRLTLAHSVVVVSRGSATWCMLEICYAGLLHSTTCLIP